MKIFLHTYLLFILSLVMSLGVKAQDSSVMHSSLYGVGAANVLDTYLSPYNFHGVDLKIMRETMRQTGLMLEHVHYQTLFDVDLGYLHNRPKNANEYTIGIRYANAWMYKFVADKPLDLYAGIQPSAYLGGIFNTRNGNNPAEAKADIVVNATALAKYDLKLFGKTFPLKYQLTVPLVGAAFSINYGQSYYEAFGLGNYDNNVVFVHPFNMPSMRNLFTVDIPVRRSFLRIGWCGEFNQSKLNGIRYHSYTNSLMIGYTKYFNR